MCSVAKPERRSSGTCAVHDPSHRRQVDPGSADPLGWASLAPQATARGSKLADCSPLASCSVRDKRNILLQAFDLCVAVEYYTQSPHTKKREIMVVSISSRSKYLLLLFQRQISLGARQGNLREYYKRCL